jgi:hypothetical protein
MPDVLMQFSLANPAVYQRLKPTLAMKEMETRIRAGEVAVARQANLAGDEVQTAGQRAIGLTKQQKAWKQLLQGKASLSHCSSHAMISMVCRSALRRVMPSQSTSD